VPLTPPAPLGRHRPACAPIGPRGPRGLACRGAGGPRPWTHAPHGPTTWRAASARCSGSLDGPLGDFLGQLRRCQLDASPVSTHLQEHVGEGQLGSRNLFIRCGSRELTIVRGTICKIRRIWHPHPHFSPKPLYARNRPRGLRHQLAPSRPLGSLCPPTEQDWWAPGTTVGGLSHRVVMSAHSTRSFARQVGALANRSATNSPVRTSPFLSLL
jgi:hypothetical protein